jgi:hypothetical protein
MGVTFPEVWPYFGLGKNTDGGGPCFVRSSFRPQYFKPAHVLRPKSVGRKQVLAETGTTSTYNYIPASGHASNSLGSSSVFLFWPEYGQTLGNVTPTWYFMTALQDRVEVTFWPQQN